MVRLFRLICVFITLLGYFCPAEADIFSSYGLSSTYTAGALADQVTSLPGALGPLMSKQFSGYLDISPTKALHYMYFESEGNPATGSVIFWTNGGPGTRHCILSHHSTNV